MPFTRRYLFWLIVPPAAVTIPAAFVFIAQLVHLTAGTAAIVLFLLLALYAGVGLVYARTLTQPLRQLETTTDDPSAAMSRVLAKTKSVAATAWVAGAVLFALLAMLLVMRSALGLGYFAVAALIVGFPSTAWSYAAGKHRLLERGKGAQAVHYSGRQLPLGRKIALVFIGSFLIAATVLVQMVSSKVSTSLEQLAINSENQRFQRLYDSANIMATVDARELDDLRDYIPKEYSLHLIQPTGEQLSTKDPLTADEVGQIRRIRNGDSSLFVSPHVSRFAQLKNGAVLALSIPWAPYENIPRQITFYTLLIALITMIAFAAAAYFLARDVTRPVDDLRALAAELTQGNFDARSRVFSDDEIGQLADSFDETRQNLRRLLGRIGGSGTTITQGVRVITGGTEGLLLRARDQAELTESSSLAVENVRGGIATVLSAADTVSGLTQDASSRAMELQASAEEVARSMDYLFQSVEKTSASTTEMNASMREMSQGTDVLAGIGDEVLSFVSQMDSTIEELRQTSQATASISRQVREDAEAGGAAVGRTVEGINLSEEMTDRTATVLDELQKSVGQISQILNVIEEITNRTNLLALNAAIIAAQAGEHGLGFTVVADEIRQLAERTRGSTKEIGTIIKAVQMSSRQAVSAMKEGVARVRDNVRLAEDAASSLTKIVGSASESYEMATKISRALDDQAKASRHLHEVTSRMSDHIAEINRATREQARGTQLHAQEAERVREIAAQVRNATDEQSQAGRGITTALEKIADDARAMRDLLESQMRETDRIADASKTMLDIAQQNDAIAREFNTSVQSIVRSGQDFEAEVARFRFTG
ncbi:MAG TPA: HAMP domain-containing methyl-accepting chemotaxis protein [Thermoanaerobaculia bacterium]|jgi:methyl-accepting chemotaxis protein|nr:HAMP domain-containing methyl-accepting chemotaxis protein [Thermoanaerobaculia bacterium]